MAARRRTHRAAGYPDPCRPCQLQIAPTGATGQPSHRQNENCRPPPWEAAGSSTPDQAVGAVRRERQSSSESSPSSSELSSSESSPVIVRAVVLGVVAFIVRAVVLGVVAFIVRAVISESSPSVSSSSSSRASSLPATRSSVSHSTVPVTVVPSDSVMVAVVSVPTPTVPQYSASAVSETWSLMLLCLARGWRQGQQQDDERRSGCGLDQLRPPCFAKRIQRMTGS